MLTAMVAISVASIAACGTVVSSWIAHRAEKNTRPISNGFASETLTRLGRIETLIVNHLEDHAESDLNNHRNRRSS